VGQQLFGLFAVDVLLGTAIGLSTAALPAWLRARLLKPPPQSGDGDKYVAGGGAEGAEAGDASEPPQAAASAVPPAASADPAAAGPVAPAGGPGAAAGGGWVTGALVAATAPAEFQTPVYMIKVLYQQVPPP
jgi:hypothetical protein